jgi:hypothetical protein
MDDAEMRGERGLKVEVDGRRGRERGEEKYLGKCRRFSLLPNLHVGYCDFPKRIK